MSEVAVSEKLDSHRADLVVVGAGAAGLATSIFAAETASAAGRYPPRVVLLDGAKSVGAKILVSGGGRCNVTHDAISPADFNGSRNIVRNVLAAFDERATVRWFESLGVRLKREETGKLFPVTDSARTVLAALLGRCAALGVTLLSGHRVTDVVPPSPQTGGDFLVHHQHGTLRAAYVAMATGGRSLPRTGSDGFGWEIVRRLGHSVTDTYPALVPLVLGEGWFHADLSGLSHEAELSTFAAGKLIDRRTGSMLWTHFGVSGPVVMDASRHWVIARVQGAAAEVRCNVLPGETFESAERTIIDRGADQPRASVSKVLATLLPARLGDALLHHAGVESSLPAGQLARDARRRLVHALTALPLPVVRDRGWNYAEVTAGGVPLGEIDFRTMESRKTPGLYLVGEILDCDGRIGGFNFQWAWATGYVAGRAVGARISDANAVAGTEKCY